MKTLTRFIVRPVIEDTDFIVLDTADHVRLFRKRISYHPEHVDIFQHVICQVFEYINDENEIDSSIMEFSQECVDIIYGTDESNMAGRIDMFNYIEDFSHGMYQLTKALGLFIDRMFIYSFKRMVGDDIVLGYEPELFIGPTALQTQQRKLS